MALTPAEQQELADLEELERLEAEEAAFQSEQRTQAQPTGRIAEGVRTGLTGALRGFGVPAPERLARGIEAGFRRTDEQFTGLPEQAGQFVGRFGPSIAASTAAGALLAGPPGAGAGFLRGVAAPALAEAAGAGLGELGGQAIAGQFQPKQALGTGLGAGVGGGALRGAAFGLKKAIPVVADVFTRKGAESIRRGIERPEIIPPLTKSAASLEKETVVNLRKLQFMSETARARLGKIVDAAVNRLAMKVGKGRVNLSGAADRAEEVLSEALSNPITGQVLDKGEVSVIQGVISSIRKNPLQDIRSAWTVRKTLDSLTDFKEGAVQKVSSDVGQRAIKAATRQIRGLLDEVSVLNGVPQFTRANARFSAFADTFDNELGKLIGTKSLSRADLLGRINSLTAMLNRGGFATEIVDTIGQLIPGSKAPAKKLVDNLAARAFTGLPIPTVSGALLNALRLAGAPRVLGTGIRATAPLRPVVGPTGAVSGILGSQESPRRKNQIPLTP